MRVSKSLISFPGTFRKPKIPCAPCSIWSESSGRLCGAWAAIVQSPPWRLTDALGCGLLLLMTLATHPVTHHYVYLSHTTLGSHRCV